MLEIPCCRIKYPSRRECSTPAESTAGWGAIAYVALQNCTKNAKDCEATVWFNHKCGAVSSDPGPTAIWGLGKTVGRARAAAQSQCMKGGGKGCEVQISTCSNEANIGRTPAASRIWKADICSGANSQTLSRVCLANSALLATLNPHLKRKRRPSTPFRPFLFDKIKRPEDDLNVGPDGLGSADISVLARDIAQFPLGKTPHE